MQANEILDAKGLLCPMPIVKLSKKINEIPVGTVLEIQADDEAAKADIPAWCAKTGNEFLGMEEASGYTRFFVKKVK